MNTRKCRRLTTDANRGQSYGCRLTPCVEVEDYVTSTAIRYNLSSDGSDEDDHLEMKRKLRKERNRESAMLSRARKNDKLTNLMEENNDLISENQRLREMLAKFTGVADIDSVLGGDVSSKAGYADSVRSDGDLITTDNCYNYARNHYNNEPEAF